MAMSELNLFPEPRDDPVLTPTQISISQTVSLDAFVDNDYANIYESQLRS